ncbi:MAG: twin-arginine translocation signal domain-containing protein [Actinobacteria bacterium]|nr:twin-arginine translocation signal domain-containing protein [Actinomycetota bacterium]
MTEPSVRPLTRRSLLAGLGATGAGLVLAACGQGQPDVGATQDATGAPATTPQDGDAAVQAALDAAGVDAPVTMTVLVASFEPMTGPGRRLQFGLLDEGREPALDLDVRAHLVRADDATDASGPLEATFHGEGLEDRGVYVVETDLEQPGTYDLVVVTADGSAAGTAAIRVITPEQSAVVNTGEEFPAIETPTVEDPKDLEELCTRDPDCGMHGISLDTALAEGAPTVLVISTPKYCATRICGPVVDVVLQVREETERDDVRFIHAEVFKDAGNTPTDVVTELQLPTEPWTFVIAGDGTLAERFDGPVVPSLLREAVAAL